MSLVWVIIAVIGQFFIGGMLGMLAIFAGTGATDTPLSAWQMDVLMAAMFVLPGLAVVSAVLLIYGYNHQWSGSTYLWQLLPLAGAALYVVFVLNLGAD